MSARRDPNDEGQQQTKRHLATLLVKARSRSGLTQAQIAAQMGTTQTAVARLESGRQSPTVETLQNYARANGFCLEIALINSAGNDARTGCVFVLENSPSASR